MPVSPFALTTLANLKEVLGIATADTSKDASLERVIDRTTLFIEGEIRRKLKARKYNGNTPINPALVHPTTNVVNEDYLFFSGSTTDYGGDTVIDPNCSFGLYYLPAYPVRPNAETGSVTFVVSVLTERSAGGETWDTTILNEYRDYLIDREKGELRLLSGPFTPGVRNYRITMCAGYVTIPADLEGLCLELARDIYRDSRELASESIGTWSRSYDKSKSDPYVEGLLSRFSRTIL